MVRELALRRRRSRVPWVFLVYSRRERGGRVPPEATASEGGPAAASALPAQERRHVEERIGLERVIA